MTLTEIKDKYLLDMEIILDEWFEMLENNPLLVMSDTYILNRIVQTNKEMNESVLEWARIGGKSCE